SAQPSPASINSTTELMISSRSEKNYHKSSLLNDGYRLNLDNTAESWFYYFEVTILSHPNVKDTTIAVGLTTKPYPNFRKLFQFVLFGFMGQLWIIPCGYGWARIYPIKMSAGLGSKYIFARLPGWNDHS
ncbi:9680_t:CDS:2, partial [Dentiscutata heterogama]